jgi:cytochrome b
MAASARATKPPISEQMQANTLTLVVMHTLSTRIWDLPTRIFHWLLAACVMALVVTAKIGGNAMEWHLRLGHAVMALLVFRLIWGFIGGYWSRFTAFIPSPQRLVRHFNEAPSVNGQVGHNPLGALSVVAMLLALLLQGVTGLFSNDEIAFSGSLTRFAGGDAVNAATTWHTGWGQWLSLALIGLHLCAITYYAVVKHQRLVAAMLHGDQAAPQGTRASQDDGSHRWRAMAVIAVCSAGAWCLYRLGNTSFF